MSAAAWPGPQQHSFTTADPLEAREILDQAFGGRVRVNVTAPASPASPLPSPTQGPSPSAT